MTRKKLLAGAIFFIGMAVASCVAKVAIGAERVGFEQALDAYLLATTWATPHEGGIAIHECADVDRAMQALAGRPELIPLAGSMVRRIPAMTGQIQAISSLWMAAVMSPDGWKDNKNWTAEALTRSLHGWVLDHAVYFAPALEGPLREAVLDAGMEPGRGLSAPDAPSTASLPPGCDKLPCCGKNIPGCGGCWQTKCDCSPCQGDECICRRVDPDGVWLPCLPTPNQCSLIIKWPKPQKVTPQDAMQP